MDLSDIHSAYAILILVRSPHYSKAKFLYNALIIGDDDKDYITYGLEINLPP